MGEWPRAAGPQTRPRVRRRGRGRRRASRTHPVSRAGSVGLEVPSDVRGRGQTGQPAARPLSLRVSRGRSLTPASSTLSSRSPMRSTARLAGPPRRPIPSSFQARFTRKRCPSSTTAWDSLQRSRRAPGCEPRNDCKSRPLLGPFWTVSGGSSGPRGDGSATPTPWSSRGAANGVQRRWPSTKQSFVASRDPDVTDRQRS